MIILCFKICKDDYPIFYQFESENRAEGSSEGILGNLKLDRAEGSSEGIFGNFR
jgi:hypothetical protein